ncbi:hypothetical protein D9M69_694940 [compost metagenome]
MAAPTRRFSPVMFIGFRSMSVQNRLKVCEKSPETGLLTFSRNRFFLARRALIASL